MSHHPSSALTTKPLPPVRYEVLAMLQHSNHLEAEYGAGPHTISVPRMRPADGSDLSMAPPYVVDDANFKKLVAIIRIAVPYTGMILSTRWVPSAWRGLCVAAGGRAPEWWGCCCACQRPVLLLLESQGTALRVEWLPKGQTGGGTHNLPSAVHPYTCYTYDVCITDTDTMPPPHRESPEMRQELLKVGMSQMSAGSRTDVGAYHRDAGEATQQHLGDLAGQFSLMDHRSSAEVVEDLLKQGYVPSWCTACYRKGRTGEHFMKIAKAGNIHNFCHPNSLLTLQVGHLLPPPAADCFLLLCCWDGSIPAVQSFCLIAPLPDLLGVESLHCTIQVWSTHPALALPVASTHTQPC